MTELSIPRRLDSWIAEYDAKVAGVDAAISAFNAAGEALKAAAVIQGTWGDVSFSTGHVGKQEMLLSLRKSAWRHAFRELQLDTLASSKDKALFNQAMSDPPPFDLDTLAATFGPYLKDPRGSILRGLAEVFADLDPAFKSHEKMRIGAKGLPKRVIIGGIGSFYGYGIDKVRDILNALAAYQGIPLTTHAELRALEKDGEALRDDREVPDPFQDKREHARDPKFIKVRGRGVWLKKFANGNGHLFFGPEALRDVNMALAEFYGEVLPDCYEQDEARPAQRTGTAVAKDLQFYPTPAPVIERLMRNWGRLEGKRVLEPSCGEGAIMDALRKKGADVIGVEFDFERAKICAKKGLNVFQGNFLETTPAYRFENFDMVVMNPPFYGKHYAKHVTHATRFLKPGGHLIAILPVTAKTDHGLLTKEWADANGMKIPSWEREAWEDLPVGSFATSGTNINTVIFHAFKI